MLLVGELNEENDTHCLSFQISMRENTPDGALIFLMCVKIPGKEELKEGKFYFDLKGIAHHGGEDAKKKKNVRWLITYQQ